MFFDELAALVRAGIVHGVDHLDLGADGRDHPHYVLSNFVARDSDRNAHDS
ncbi:hypothetical protein SDC9_119669 [bioreactor metagenome]|uniref:Uncharacterized protein n=1 Tax=bioreactor metagenome TaxID=1076179 RepID=A0A645C8V0_9ZZZZ